jgi:hypothetical protein
MWDGPSDAVPPIPVCLCRGCSCPAKVRQTQLKASNGTTILYRITCDDSSLEAIEAGACGMSTAFDDDLGRLALVWNKTMGNP